MNKAEYLEALRKELIALPIEEQTSALQFYADYFDDAGIDQEQSVMAELGSPRELGEYIRSQFSCVPEPVIAKTKSYTDPRFAKDSDKSKNKSSKNVVKNESNANGISLILLILLLAITFPFWFPVVITIGAIILGLTIASIAIGFVGVVVSVAIIAAAVFAFVVSISQFFITPAMGFLGVGTAVMLCGIGLMLGVFGIWLCTKVVPVILRFIVKVLQLPFKSRMNKREN